MAEGTRWRELQDAQKQLDQNFKSEAAKREATDAKVQDQFTGMNSMLDNLANLIATLQLQLLNNSKGKGVGESESILGEPTPMYVAEAQHSQYNPQNSGRMISESQEQHPLPRVEFPSFDGSAPRKWILKCNGYFQIVPNLSHAQKISLATMNFEGKANVWYHNSSSKCVNITWEQFLGVVSTKFEEIKEENVIEEFTKIRHVGSYEEYVDKFEDLKACMELFNTGGFSEQYYKSTFIGGLSLELKSAIKMFKPKTLQDAIELGKEQLVTMDAWAKKFKGGPKPFCNTSPTMPARSYPQNSNSSNTRPTTKQPIKYLTYAEMAARREKGLCYNCDDKFTPGHRCRPGNKINYSMMSEEQELRYLQSSSDTEVEVDEEPPMEETVLSLNTLKGNHDIYTMKFTGHCEGQELNILIDTGSTLSFIKESTAQKLGCNIEEVAPILIRVVNGEKMISTKQVAKFSWMI